MKKGLKKFAASIAILALVLSAAGTAGAQKAWVAQPLLKIHTTAASGPVGMTPAQMTKAYGVDKLITNGTNGTGMTIAIVDAYGCPTMQSDLNSFCSTFNIPSTTITIAYPTGKPTTVDGDWGVETAMDVEWAHVMAPNATILLCVAKSASNSDLLAAENYAGTHSACAVSNSWGGSDISSYSTYESYFKHTGVVFLASSGDNGSGVEWPATSPNVVAVGGTLLKIADSTGTYQSESGWTGSGGGLSRYVPMPSYQSAVSSIVGKKRGNPDVSMDADPNSGAAVYDTTPDSSGTSGWFQVGGTSLSSPCWAGIVALCDQGRLAGNYSSSTFLTKLYSIYSGTSYKTYFNDITSGSNGGYTAKAGYDLVTGIGTPKANTLVPYMAAN